MKVKFNKGVRLYYNKKSFLWLDRIVLALLVVLAALFAAYKGVTYLANTISPVKATVITKVEAMEGVANYVVEEETEEVIVEEPVKEVWDYRMTYYYTGDETNSTSITASGKTTDQFKVNDRGWYTYNGKLVVATASKRLLSWEQYKDSTVRMFNLYDELVLTINGVEYEAIVLDVCGAAMKSDKIDLFVSNKASGLDTQIKVEVK